MKTSYDAQARGGPRRPSTLADYLAILRRRKWVLIVLPLVTGLAAFAYAHTTTRSYSAEALVLLDRTNVVSGVTGAQDPAALADSTRFLATQANIARSPQLAARVAAQAGVSGLTGGGVLTDSSVQPDTSSDLLRFSVTSATAADAVRITNLYASEFTKFKTALDTARVNNALQEIRARMNALKASGQSGGAAYQTLTDYQSQLLISKDLLTNSASVLRPASKANVIGTPPLRMFFAGALLGLLLAAGVVVLMEALDRRVRTEEELETALELPLLGRVAPPSHELEKSNRLVMLAEPLSSHAEAFRRLRTNIEFANRERKARTIMFTSAVPREGKSTTIANVALAFAWAGRRVALIDLDVRAPSQHTLFGVRSSPGVAGVVVDGDSVDQAIQRIVLPISDKASEGGVGNGRPMTASGLGFSETPARRRRQAGQTQPAVVEDTESSLHLLVSGRVPAPEAEFLGSQRVADLLARLSKTFDVVLVDAPPLLAVGDAAALLAKVDAVVVVTRLGITRPLLSDLARQLENCPATELGLVVTGVSLDDSYGYAYEQRYGYGAHIFDLYSKAADRTRHRVDGAIKGDGRESKGSAASASAPELEPETETEADSELSSRRLWQ